MKTYDQWRHQHIYFATFDAISKAQAEDEFFSGDFSVPDKITVPDRCYPQTMRTVIGIDKNLGKVVAFAEIDQGVKSEEDELTYVFVRPEHRSVTHAGARLSELILNKALDCVERRYCVALANQFSQRLLERSGFVHVHSNWWRYDRRA